MWLLKTSKISSIDGTFRDHSGTQINIIGDNKSRSHAKIRRKTNSKISDGEIVLLRSFSCRFTNTSPRRIKRNSNRATDYKSRNKSKTKRRNIDEISERRRGTQRGCIRNTSLSRGRGIKGSSRTFNGDILTKRHTPHRTRDSSTFESRPGG